MKMQPVPRILGIAVFALLTAGASARSPRPDLPSTSHGHQSPAVPDWLQGLWIRAWIERKGIRSDRFDIHYLQSPGFYADLRIPRERASSGHAASFADLSDGDLRLLARQQAFAGRTMLSAQTATWSHLIDFQPPGSEGADVGRIERLPDGNMNEHAPDGEYTESWTRIARGEGRFLVINTEAHGRPLRMLVTAGDYFMYVRNRAKDLSTAESLDALINATHATRTQIIAMLDCEFSFGRIQGGSKPWEIQRSTLPWLEGRRLAFVDQIELAEDGRDIRLRSVAPEQWSVPINSLTPSQLAGILRNLR